MKKVFAILSLVALLVVSCKSSQGVSEKQSSLVDEEMGEQLKVDICQTLQEEKPGSRAFGNAQHFKLSTAKNMAALQARAELASNLEQMILSALNDGSAQDQQYAGDSQQGANIYDGLGVSEESIEALTMGIVKNTMIIKTSSYLKPNRQYNVYVCIEYANDPKQVAEETAAKVEQLIPDEKKAELKSRLENMKENLLNRLSR
ncbi:hypothetical protein [Barnesiella viscericola]|uniref:hypothetical protein n=1 Tax=Barnesiella viscericola TaxID=397865 RepID=UPI002355008D|nr:hypothetical protein [Barnesiella viscericola]